MNSVIKIGEQEYKLKYTVRALFVYERLTGKSYDLGGLMNDYLLLYSILLAVNETFDMKFNDFIDQCDLNPSIFNEFKKWALKDVSLPDLAELEERIYWSGIKY